MSGSLADELTEGADTLGVSLGRDAIDRLLRLLDLLEKWNAVYNLTALKTREEWVTHHFLDALSVAPFLEGSRMLDVGTGPGFPGLPLAIAHPEHSWTLVDSNQKKTSFAAQAVAELGLANVDVKQIRIEMFRPPYAYDFVVSRAFADLADFARLAGPLVAPSGRLVAMKGKVFDRELAALPTTFHVERIVPLMVPGVDAERHLILMQPVRHQA